MSADADDNIRIQSIDSTEIFACWTSKVQICENEEMQQYNKTMQKMIDLEDCYKIKHTRTQSKSPTNTWSSTQNTNNWWLWIIKNKCIT